MNNLTIQIALLAEMALMIYYLYLVISLVVESIKNRGKIMEEEVSNENDNNKLFKLKRNDVIQHITKSEEKLKYYSYYVSKITKVIGHGPYRICAVRKMNHTVNGCDQEVLVECFVKETWKILRQKNHLNDAVTEEYWIQGWLFSP